MKKVILIDGVICNDKTLFKAIAIAAITPQNVIFKTFLFIKKEPPLAFSLQEIRVNQRMC